jgi:hypothetical protein
VTSRERTGRISVLCPTFTPMAAGSALPVSALPGDPQEARRFESRGTGAPDRRGARTRRRMGRHHSVQTLCACSAHPKQMPMLSYVREGMR